MILHIRNMTEDDLEFINFVRNHSLTRFSLKNSSHITLKETIEWFHRDNPKWKIVESNDEKVGDIRTSLDTGETICIGCDIHPDFRRRGFAEYAYGLMIKELYERNYALLWLEVFDDNLPARNLYKKLGFIDVTHRFVNGRKYIAMVHVRL